MKKKKQTARELFILFLVKAGMSNIPVSSKLVKARKVVTMMTGNANYTTPIPSLSTITTVTDALETAEVAMDGSKIKTQQRDLALNLFQIDMNQLQAYVETTAKGDVEKILSSGFEVRNPATKAVKLSAPVEITVIALSSALNIKWKTNKKAILNVIQVSTTSDGKGWDLGGETTKSTITINELTPGTTYYLRVAHINAAGIGEWSEVVVCIPNF
ncbi:MAG: fibronectin type III domain-containing protein [Bacteroidetes bacterium]|nr:fibronectin type III domain-containing protein [Bacteroidota bacterium]